LHEFGELLLFIVLIRVSPQRTDALFSSVGIAAGNAATFVPLLLLGVLPFIYLYLQVR
jgi:hypothetical protein